MRRGLVYAFARNWLIPLLVLGSLLLALVPASVVAADSVVNFPDENLDATVRAYIDKPTGDIHESDLAGLTYLGPVSDELSISDLTGLEHCTGLTSLEFPYQNIGDISPLSGLTALTHLRLDGNSIGDVGPVANLTNLTYLGLESNQIASVSALAGLTNLDELSLCYNQIGDLSPLSGLTKLTKLYLGSNRISDLGPLAGLGKLVELSLYENSIGSLTPLANLTGLEDLSLEENQIANLSPLSGLSRLEDLSLGQNQISDLSPLSQLSRLSSLDVDNNDIEDLSPLAGLASLYYLSLEGNQISSLSPLAGITKLHALILNNNLISDVEPLAGNEGITADDEVYLRGNPLNSASLNTWIPALRTRRVVVFIDGPLAVETDQAGNVGTASATLNGTLTCLGTASGVYVSFEWGLTASYGNLITTGAWTRPGWPRADISGLAPGTTYHFRARVMGGTTAYGADRTFTTLTSGDPVVTFPDANLRAVIREAIGKPTGDVYESDLQFGVLDAANRGIVDLAGLEHCDIALRLDLTGNQISDLSPLSNIAVDNLYLDSNQISDIGPLVNSGLGPESSVTLRNNPLSSVSINTYIPALQAKGVFVAWDAGTFPSVATNTAADLTQDSAALNGNLNGLGAATSAQVSFEWGTTAAYGNTTTPQTMTATGAFISTISGLTAGTTYHFRAKVVAGGMTDYGEDRTFDTSSDINPAAPDTAITNGFSGIIREDRITFAWTGTDDATPPAGLQYSFYLKGRDMVWSPWLPLAEATLTGLADGDYTFMVKAKDTDGNEDPTPAEMSFTVDAQWSFAVITDLHIGWGYPDYGGPGHDETEGGQDYYLTDRLEGVVRDLNSRSDIEFVVVLGDISDTAEKSEFIKARDILNQLNVPYVPLIGNHDIDPYTEKPGFPFSPDGARNDKEHVSSLPCGDQYFNDVFWTNNPGNLEKINRLFGDSWHKQTIGAGQSAVLENYAFEMGDVTFVAMDTVPRPDTNLPPKGIVYGETLDWLNREVEEGDNVILLSHIDPGLYVPSPVAEHDIDDINSACSGAEVLAWFAGHTHNNDTDNSLDDAALASNKWVTTSSIMRESRSFPIGQTADCIRVVTRSCSSKQIVKMDTVAVPESTNVAPTAYFTCSSDTVGRFTAYPYCPPGGSDDWQYLWQFEGSISGPATWCGDRAVDWLAPGRHKVTLTVRNGTNTSYEQTMEVDVWAVLSAHCPVDLVVTDPNGLTAQKDAGLLNGMCYRELDIDGDGDVEDVVAIPDHQAGSYSITVMPDEGVQAGDTYTLLVELPGHLAFAAIDIPVEDGVAHSYSAVWEEVASGDGTVTVQIDSDGDGEFEKTVTSDGELTADEFRTESSSPVHLWVYLAAGAGGLAVLGILGASLALLLRRRPAR